MKRIFLLLFIIVINNDTIKAQVIDTMILKCQYKFVNSVTENLSEDDMVLEIGKQSCKFYSYHNYKVDSLRKKNPNNMYAYHKTSNLFKVYVNYPNNKITVTDFAFGILQLYEYSEDFKYPQWKILNDTQTILSHKCKKAICHYKGRDYTAWYATDIPISRGPFKFAGLPGLILKINDTKNYFSFECISIIKARGFIIKDMEKRVKYITRGEFFKIDKRSFDNPKETGENIHKMLGMSSKDIIFKGKDGTITTLDDPRFNRKLDYDRIELEE